MASQAGREGKSYTAAMAAPGSGGRLVALPLAWLAGVALQLQRARAAGRSASYRRRCARPRVAAAIVALRGACVRAGGVRAAGRRRARRGLRARPAAQASLRLAEALPAELEGRDVVVTGVVASLPQQGPSGLRFRFEVEPARGAPAARAAGCSRSAGTRLPRGRGAGRSRAGAARRPALALHRAPAPAARQPQPARLRLRAGAARAGRARHRLRARRAGDAARRERRRIRSSGCASACATRSTRASPTARRRRAGGARGRRPGRDRARRLGPVSQHRRRPPDVASAACTSRCSRGSPALLVGAVWRRSARAMRWLPAPSAARWGGLVAATAYAVFAGWGVPSQRTVWMLATVDAAAGRAALRWPWPLVLLGAAVVVTLFDPWALTQPGFWLSFMAVGLLMASSRGERHAARSRRPTTRPAGAAGRRDSPRACAAAAHAGRRDARPDAADAGLLPAGVAGRLRSPTWSRSRWSRWWSRRSRCSASLLRAALVAGRAAIVQALDALLARAGRAARRASGRSPAAPLVGAARRPARRGAASCCRCRGAPRLARRAARAAAARAAAWRCRAEGSFDSSPPTSARAPPCWCARARTLLLFDTGPQYSRESDAGQRVLRAAAARARRARIDLLVLSHRDSDHVGGARSAAARAAGRRALELARGRPSAARAAPRPRTRCVAGQRWGWDGVRFDGPASAAPTTTTRALQAERDVVRAARRRRRPQRAADRRHRARAGGRAGRRARRRRCAATCCVVPHHGSRTSSTRARSSTRCGRAIAVFQAGYRNRFGHPAAEVRRRATASAASRSSPARRAAPGNGAPTAPADGACERDVARRYWQHRERAPARRRTPSRPDAVATRGWRGLC